MFPCRILFPAWPGTDNRRYRPGTAFSFSKGIAGQQPEVRTGDALAISVPATNGKDTAVLLIQCRQPQEAKRSDLVGRVQRLIHRELLIDCTIELVPRHTLPRTTMKE